MGDNFAEQSGLVNQALSLAHSDTWQFDDLAYTCMRTVALEGITIPYAND